MFFIVYGQGNALPLQRKIDNGLWLKKKLLFLLCSPKHYTYSATLFFSKYTMPSDFTFLPEVMIFSGHICLEPRIIFFSYHVLCVGSRVTDFSVHLVLLKNIFQSPCNSLLCSVWLIFVCLPCDSKGSREHMRVLFAFSLPASPTKVLFTWLPLINVYIRLKKQRWVFINKIKGQRVFRIKF